MGRVCHGPSLLWAEMSSYQSRYENLKPMNILSGHILSDHSH